MGIKNKIRSADKQFIILAGIILLAFAFYTTNQNNVTQFRELTLDQHNKIITNTNDNTKLENENSKNSSILVIQAVKNITSTNDYRNNITLTYFDKLITHILNNSVDTQAKLDKLILLLSKNNTHT